MADYDPSTLYGAGYQRDAVDPKAMLAWAAIAGAFADIPAIHAHSTNWLDVGCGPGGLIASLKRWNYDILGIEGSREALGLLPVPIIYWDLRQPLNIGCDFSIVSCFDVAEHIGNADAIVETCATHTKDTLLFGAAPPGQDGLGHIDCRPHEEWTARFAAEDLHLNQDLTDTLRAALREAPGANHCWWVEKNLHAYQRR